MNSTVVMHIDQGVRIWLREGSRDLSCCGVI